MRTLSFYNIKTPLAIENAGWISGGIGVKILAGLESAVAARISRCNLKIKLIKITKRREVPAL